MEEKIKKLRKEHEKLVKGIFEFTDAQGGWLDFSYRFFPGEPILTIRLTHGEICDLPMGIVKHLNNCYKKVRLFDVNGNGSTIPDGVQLTDSSRGVPSTYTKTSRVRFTPMDMM